MLTFLRIIIKVFSSCFIFWLWSPWVSANTNLTTCPRMDVFAVYQEEDLSYNASEQEDTLVTTPGEEEKSNYGTSEPAKKNVFGPVYCDVSEIKMNESFSSSPSQRLNPNFVCPYLKDSTQNTEEDSPTISGFFDYVRPYIAGALPYLDTPVNTFSVTAQALRKWLEAIDYPIQASIIGLTGSSVKIIFHYTAGKDVTAAQHLDFWENILLGIEANILYTLNIEEEVKTALEEHSKLPPPRRRAWLTQPLKLGTPIRAQSPANPSRQPSPLSLPLPLSVTLAPLSSLDDVEYRPAAPTHEPPLMGRPQPLPSTASLATTPEREGHGPSLPETQRAPNLQTGARRQLFFSSRNPPSLVTPIRAGGASTDDLPGESPSSIQHEVDTEQFSIAAVLELHVQGVSHLIYIARALRVMRYSVKFLLTTLGESTAIAQEYPAATPFDIVTSPVYAKDLFPGLATRAGTAAANVGNNVFKCVRLNYLVAGVATYRGSHKLFEFHKKINDPEKPKAWNSPEALKDLTLGVILLAQAPLTLYAKTRTAKFTFGTLLALEVFANYWSFKMPGFLSQ